MISVSIIGVRFLAGAREFFLHSVQTLLWDSPIFPYNGYWGLFPRGVKLTTHLHLVLRLKMMELYLHSPVRLQGVVLN
jgi:hypothetical protein